MLRFVGSRLLRALVSLILFQIILFALIQALPKTHAAMSEREALAQALDQSGPRNDAAREEADTVAEPTPAGSDAVPDEFAALRESGRPEMIALLDEAALLEKAVQQEAASVAVAAAPQEEPAPQEGPAPEKDDAPEESDPLIAYAEGLAAIRPPEEPAWRQFLNWLVRFFRGDLGVSVAPGGGAVVDILADGLPTTLLLLLPGTAAGLLLGIWLGKRVAWRRRSWLDLAATLGGTAFYTSFPPWLAFVLVAVFAVNLRWFPVEKLRNSVTWSRVDVVFNEMVVRMLQTFGALVLAYLLGLWLTRRLSKFRAPLRALAIALPLALAITLWSASGRAPLALDILHHLALPSATLILLSFGETMLIMRTTMAEVMEEGHVAQVKAMGLADSRVRDRHVAPVAVLPVLTRFIVHIPFVIIGSFFLEHAFSLDGMGKRLVEAANEIDLPVVMGVLSIVGIGILLAHVFFDVLSAWLDPRLRLGDRSGAT